MARKERKGSLSSSTIAFIKYLSGVEEGLISGEERDEITAMMDQARSITKDTKAVELVIALRTASPEIRRLTVYHPANYHG